MTAPEPGWTVYTSWQATPSTPAQETTTHHHNWPTARLAALGLACCNGVRYVAVQDPDGWVVGEYDRYTNRWCQYDRPFGICGNEREPDGEVCTTPLRIGPSALQVRCPTCGAWHGAGSRPGPQQSPTVPSRA